MVLTALSGGFQGSWLVARIPLLGGGGPGGPGGTRRWCCVNAGAGGSKWCGSGGGGGGACCCFPRFWWAWRWSRWSPAPPVPPPPPPLPVFARAAPSTMLSTFKWSITGGPCPVPCPITGGPCPVFCALYSQKHTQRRVGGGQHGRRVSRRLRYNREAEGSEPENYSSSGRLPHHKRLLGLGLSESGGEIW